MTTRIRIAKQVWLVAYALLFIPFNGLGQALKGVVRDAETQEPLRYATVSIISKNQRVITRHDGTFNLDVSRANASDSITFSYIGYETVASAIGDLDLSNNQQFMLRPSVYSIEPVIVSARERKTTDKGFTKPSSRRTGWGDFSSGRGRMRGVVIPSMDCSNPIKSFVFRIRDNEWDSVAFRLELWSFKDGKPDKSLLPENIIIHTGDANKWVTVDLAHYGIIPCGDLFATLEWVDAWGMTGEFSNVLTLSLARGAGTVFTKEANEYEGKLQEAQPPLAMYVEVFRN